jgi:hypothetical protein
MASKHFSLGTVEMQEIVEHIDRCLDIFDRNSGRFSAMEVSLRSMLTTLRKELVTELRFRGHDAGNYPTQS